MNTWDDSYLELTLGRVLKWLYKWVILGFLSGFDDDSVFLEHGVVWTGINIYWHIRGTSQMALTSKMEAAGFSKRYIKFTSRHGVISKSIRDNFYTYVSMILTFWRRNIFFLILAHPVYKMWIIQEPNTLELWNKLHFEEKKTECIYLV